MTSTVATWELDGIRRVFDVTFDYLSKSFIRVRVTGVEDKNLVLGTDYVFISNTQIETVDTYGGPSYSVIELRRVTPATERVVEFHDSSVLTAGDLNLSDLQALHIAEEARDAVVDTISVNEEGNLDARGRRIVRVADASTPDGAMTFGQYLGDKNSVKEMMDAASASAEAAAASAASVSAVVYPTIAALKASPRPTRKVVATVLGYYSEGDCEPWSMVWVNGSSKSPNDGDVVAVDSSQTGRYECGPSVASRAEVWGGANAGKLVVQRVNTALSVSSSKTVVFPKGEFLATSAESISVNRQGSKLTALNAYDTALRHPKVAEKVSSPLILVNAGDFEVSNLELDGGRPYDSTQKSPHEHGRNSVVASYSGVHGILVQGCVITDTYRRALGFQATDVKIIGNTFKRNGTWASNVAPFDAAVHVATGCRAVTVAGNKFFHSGQYHVTALDSEDVYVVDNTMRYSSQIAIGGTRCTNIHAERNNVKYTYNSGIDFQQCTGNFIRNNRMKSCGYGRLDSILLTDTRAYQSIFCGDDYATSEASTKTRYGEISGNIIRGDWYAGKVAEDDSEGGTKWSANWENLGLGDMTGCGIVLVSAREVTVHNNLLNGIGLYFKTDLQEQGKDGVGIKVANYCRDLQIFSNVVNGVKLDSILMGTGNFYKCSISSNNVDTFGRRGIAVQANSRLDTVSIDDNDVSGCLGLHDQPTSSDIYVSGLSVTLEKLMIRDNSVGSASGAVDEAAHRIFFDKKGTMGVGYIRVTGNRARNNAKTSNIAFSDVPSITPGRWHRNSFADNTVGRFDQGQIIEVIVNLPEIPFDTIGGIPLAGFHARGSIAWYDTPVAGGSVGAVCVQSGTPGVWKSFGTINS